MGAVAGILHWTGAPIERVNLERMVRASAHRGPDGAASRIGDRAALAHLRFTTVAPGAGDQPLVDPVRALWFVFDGRLDNREELIDRLDVVDSDASDARLALEAFARWDSGAPRHLLGDFAFIGWDDRRRRLVCARDPMGVRHLHYYASRDCVVCATDLAQVLAHPSVPREPEPSVAADYLAGNVRNTPATLYRGVCRVPPGHVLVGDAGSVRLEQYWSAEPRSPIRYPRDEDYAAHCRELMTRSVEARMRSDRPIAAMLSGGLDSSSVVSIAHRVVRTGGPPPRPFSMVYPDRPESDEREFIDAVARHCGTESVHVLPGPITAGELDGQARRWVGTPAMPADEMANTLYAAMRERGHRVTLTGVGGDFLFGGSVFQYADLLRRFRVVAAVRRFVDDCHADDTGRSALGLLQAGVWPLLPPAIKSALRPLARRVVHTGGEPPWLRIPGTPAEAHPARPRGGSFATEDVTRLLGSGMHAFFVECAERAAAHAGIELRHPFLDTRLVEFGLGIPDDQRRRGRYTKYVLRQALGDDLAAPVRARRTKADFSHAVREAIESLGGEHFYASLHIAEAGWVDGDVVAAKYRTMRDQYPQGSAVYGDHVPSLWMIAAVELWFRSAFGSGPAIDSGAAAAGAPA
jgi:asparagine synthase (glutamine-hydrolysing)